MTFKESDALNPGNSFTTFPTPWCEVGVGICYDIRFAELAQVYAQKGCKLLVYPGAFNMTTGIFNDQFTEVNHPLVFKVQLTGSCCPGPELWITNSM